MTDNLRKDALAENPISSLNSTYGSFGQQAARPIALRNYPKATVTCAVHASWDCSLEKTTWRLYGIEPRSHHAPRLIGITLCTVCHLEGLRYHVEAPAVELANSLIAEIKKARTSRFLHGPLLGISRKNSPGGGNSLGSVKRILLRTPLYC